jgi:Family of unknown function (DUF5681)
MDKSDVPVCATVRYWLAIFLEIAMGKVGYGKPPLNSRYKPGQSGNPSGRPKGAASFRSDFAAELGELVSEGGST